MKSQKIAEKAYSQVFISSPDYDSVSVYAKRRALLMEKLDSICFFSGMPQNPGCEEAFYDSWTRFVQEPAFLYLTGVNQSGCYLLLDPFVKKTVLFVPRKDPFREFWVGKRLGFEESSDEIKTITGVDEVKPSDEFWKYAVEASRTSRKRHVYSFFHDGFSCDHNFRFRSTLERKLRPHGISVKNCAREHFSLRLVLEEERIFDAKHASRITGDAFRKLLMQMKSLKTERDVSLYLNYEMQKNSDGDLAFPTICAVGDNACCLHYVKNDERLQKGRLLLLDFGVRYGTLHSDVSRTIPIGGKFNPLEKLLYEIVLDAGLFYRKSVKPGVTLKEIGDIPWNFIIDALETRLVQRYSGSYTLLYDRRPHGVSHFIGEQIHEGMASSRSLDVVLESGMLISCEPGLYGEFSARIGGKLYREKVGIRIEDDLLIVPGGSVNISDKIPKTVGEIESLME